MKNILVVATGSVAIVKLKTLADLLIKDYKVKIVATEYVQQNFKGLGDLIVEKMELALDSFPEHIALAKWADLTLVVPASANTIAKFAAGIADNFALTTLLAARQPIIFVPAMNTYMYYALERRGIFARLITELDVAFIGPVVGRLRENESGMGRMVEPHEVKSGIDNFFASQHLGKRVLMPFGASRVYIDPVRFLTTNSSGSMAQALANELRLSGYQVQMVDISQLTNLEFLNFAKQHEFEIYISPAAFADYDVVTSKTKIPKNTLKNLTLLDNVDVISELRKTFPHKKFFAFKLDDDKNRALAKMQKLQLDGVLWNNLSAIGNDKSSGAFILKNKQEFEFENVTKIDVAKLIAREI